MKLNKRIERVFGPLFLHIDAIKDCIVNNTPESTAIRNFRKYYSGDDISIGSRTIKLKRMFQTLFLITHY